MAQMEDKKNEKILAKAVAVGNFKKVKKLLIAGICVDACCSKKFTTPLQSATRRGHLECVDLLIAYKANLNARNTDGATALHMAAEEGHLKCLKSLLKAGAKSSLKTKTKYRGVFSELLPPLGGKTPLHLAAQHNHIDCVKELLLYGADYNAVDDYGHTSLFVAAKWGFADCILAHLEYATGRINLSLPSLDSGDTPLHFAVKNGFGDCVKELLKLGSDVNLKNFSGSSPLHLAVRPLYQHDELSLAILKMLILDGYNVDVNQEDSCGNSLLYYACFEIQSESTRSEMAKFLIAYGADVEIIKKHGFNNGITLLEYELNSNSSNVDILRYIVRSLIHLPRLGELNTETANHQKLWYESISCNPRTLQHICRFTIRDALGCRSMKNIQHLPLPPKFKNYLLLENGE